MLVLALFSASSVHAQSTASISGVVKDTAGGVMPGVTVVVKDVNTGRTFEAVTDTGGRYEVPALQAGSYTVTASMSGFKTAVVGDVRLALGQPVTVMLTLEVGSLTETVTVQSSAELINTQTATVASTLNSDQLMRMPTPTRNALNTITFLPGINTPGTNRNSTINGLPEGFLSITLDGISNNDNFLRSTDSFFATVTPRQDAVEAVSVTLAVAGATVGGGSGAVTMAFQTRSGSNQFTGSLYEFYRNPALNSNYYFNKVNHQGKNDVKLNTFGGRAGGPIMIPGVYNGRDKAFFFFNYEQIRFPNTFTRTRTVFNSRVADGWFRYQFGSQIREVNVLALAAANGQISAKDPIMVNIIRMMNEATATTGTRAAAPNPLYDTYVWQSPSELFEHQPTMRLDYNLTNKHRLSGSYAFITAKRTPDYLNSADPQFPGSPNQRDFKSTRPILSLSMRSVLSQNITNEIRGGGQGWAGSNFGYPSSADSRNGPKTFADQGGFAITIPTDVGNWHTSNSPSWRNAPTYSLDDTLTWLKGTHSMSFGGNLLISNAESSGQQMVRGINLGVDTDFDPANFMFNTTNFPGASSAQLNDARSVYATLTGRVTSVTSQAVLDGDTNKYVELGPSVLPGGIKNYGIFAQDSWRARPNLTLTGGLRWDVQTPFVPSSSVMSAVNMESICGASGLGTGGLYSKCNFLSPGPSRGPQPVLIQLKKGTGGYKTDWNNWAPSISAAWRPDVETGFLRTLLGDPDQATIRAGYSVAYERRGISDFTGVYGGNRGISLSLTRSASLGLVPPGESWPVLLSQTNRLFPASFDEDPSYPVSVRAARADDLNAFAPDIQIARVRNWQIGFARSISKDMAVEIRYVGNKGDHQWSELDYNAIRVENLVANGFLDEFKLAMKNLAANNASGISNRRGSFAYFGADSGTSPLPIYLAYFTGRTDSTNPVAYTTSVSTTWANSTIATRLSAASPNPTGAAGDLDGNALRRTNAVNAGYPANFFVLNPAVDENNVTDSGAFSDYHAMQLELRRRLSRGLYVNVNYQYAFKEGGSAFDGFSFGRVNSPSTNVRHAIKMQWEWTLPVGRDQRFGADMNPVLNGILGGWSINGVGRVQTVLQNFGNVRLVGMSKSDLQKMYKYYFKKNDATGIDEVWMLPDDVILNTRRAFSASNATLDGYSTSLGAPTGRYIAPANSASCIQVRAGDCAPRTLHILSPWFKKFDMGATKRFDIQGRKNIEVRIDVLNVFDTPNFNPVANPGTGESIFRVTSAYSDLSNTYDPGGRIGQLMFRFNW